ncbi:ABC transporter ATP-binding protein [Oecophyllibacter saccharovorans]|uniref:ABC transporter ATP-binding protein n=1 Tax=Oecophyllibacter saccharovorans TaxID=2558360 RepID=A0A506UQS1_9PROT|nr:ABC transporter ATP-binding protein [Oecophyllibacter saccharovorans]QDH14540.1 ABC transporter ATP-binding protein [Oecophyllibacter saccharovorans]TPW34737.1 ABC transporter ATP-binding protein [Oecophyllibacter saccharovorans]TPW35678.1 ABC transporter ATP-binding protein [Oecophyllibacter saccharovorans]
MRRNKKTPALTEDLAVLPLGPVLELSEARPLYIDEGVSPVAYSLTLAAGECALIECHDSQLAQRFTDLCAGMFTLASGSAKCLGLDWQTLDERRTNALRGLMGRVGEEAGWIDFDPMQINILAPSLYHTYTPLDELVDQATTLSEIFGLPGLPIEMPPHMSFLDRRRSEYVRAFMGEPILLLLADPISREPEDLYNAFLGQMTMACDRGCAVVWIASDRSVWKDYAQEDMQFLRLSDGGLNPMRGL